MPKNEEEELLPPEMILDFWRSQRPGKQPMVWEMLNDSHKDSEKWGCAVYKIDGRDCSTLYVALQVTLQGLTARELSGSEVDFLENGTIPDEGNTT